MYTWKAELGNISEFFSDLVDVRRDAVNDSRVLKFVGGLLPGRLNKKEPFKQFITLHGQAITLLYAADMGRYGLFVCPCTVCRSPLDGSGVHRVGYLQHPLTTAFWSEKQKRK